MTIANVERDERDLIVTWTDDSDCRFPYIWLRDNCSDELHPDTHERTFDLTTVDVDIVPGEIEHTAETVSICWPGKAEASHYASQWLRSHQPGTKRSDASATSLDYWDAKTLPYPARFSANDCSTDPVKLCEALVELKRTGIIVVCDLPDDPAAGEKFGDLIGFKRETNFGVMFEVISKPDPNNLAYTSVALPLHTDVPNQEMIPGYQFLHAYRNSATGGESVFADGFRIIADLREEEPSDFELLARVAIPFRFHDEVADIRQHRHIITLRPDGEFAQFVFNAHIADVPDMSTDVLHEFYAAYQRLMIRIRKPRYAMNFALQQGEMVVFDNGRVLHGRNAFDPLSGERHLRGYYIEKNEVDSCIRVAARNRS